MIHQTPSSQLPSWGSLTERMSQETASRPDRVASLSQKVDDLFAGDALAALRTEIKATFNTPQFGKYHLEGVFMDTHLALILKTIEDVRVGTIDNRIPEEVRETIQIVVRRHHEALQKYTFLHDLEKPGCVTVTYTNGSVAELTQGQCYALLTPQGLKDCGRAYKELEAQGIDKISYHHPSTERKHGAAAVEKLQALRETLQVPDALYKAIDLHEIAYQFSNARAANFRRHFGELSPDEQGWVLTASYIDLSGSLKEGGVPDLSPLLFLVSAMRNSAAISYLESQRGPEGKLCTGMDQGKLDKRLSQLLNDPAPIVGSFDDLLSTVAAACKVPSYERGKFVAAVETLVATNVLGRAVADQICACAEGGDVVILNPERFSAVRRTLGQGNAALSRVLEGCEVR